MATDNTTTPSQTLTIVSACFKYFLIVIVSLFFLTLLAIVIVLPSYFDYLIASGQLPGVANAPAAAPVAVNATHTADGSKHFEALARYVTLAITVTSVGVAFFGYLLRKNIREVEEDLHERFERELANFKSDHTELTKALTKTIPELSKKLQELEDKTLEMLTLLEESDEAYSRASSEREPKVEQATADIDAAFAGGDAENENEG